MFVLFRMRWDEADEEKEGIKISSKKESLLHYHHQLIGVFLKARLLIIVEPCHVITFLLLVLLHVRFFVFGGAFKLRREEIKIAKLLSSFFFNVLTRSFPFKNFFRVSCRTQSPAAICHFVESLFIHSFHSLVIVNDSPICIPFEQWETGPYTKPPPPPPLPHLKREKNNR